MSPPSSQVDRRERLLESAGRLFALWGFNKTSMDDVAREAGVSKGAIYLEFPGKDELFKAVLYREFGRYSEDWLQRFERDPGDWSFARMFQHSIAAVNANPMIKALLTRDRRIYGSFLRRDTELLSQSISMRAELFKNLQDLGALRDDIPARVLAYLMTAIGYGIVTAEEVIPGENQISFEEAIRGLGLLLDRGLAPARVKNPKEARAFVIAMVEKMRAALQGGRRPDAEEN